MFGIYPKCQMLMSMETPSMARTTVWRSGKMKTKMQFGLSSIIPSKTCSCLLMLTARFWFGLAIKLTNKHLANRVDKLRKDSIFSLLKANFWKLQLAALGFQPSRTSL